MDSKQNKKNCWGCFYQKIGGVTFLGKCSWFSRNGKGEDKEIPSNIVDHGCKYFKESGSGELF